MKNPPCFSRKLTVDTIRIWGNFSVFVLFLSGASLPLAAQQTLVFEGGKEGHAIYRIPAIISLPDSTLLAFAEGRVHGSNDFGDINLVMKQSQDGGLSWSPIRTLVDYDSLQAGNPAPVVDLQNPEFPEGVIFLFYNTGNNHEYEVRLNHGVREVWMIQSTDLGQTWTEPKNITLQVHRPNNPDFDSRYQFPEDWRHYANTPGHAFQFQNGPYKGRLYIGANHSAGDPKNDWSDYQAHGFYTDDHGKSFQISESVPIPGSNESIGAEISEGRMILSSRNQKGDIRQRILSYSSDGGKTWDQSYFEEQLPDPVCQASILAIGKEGGKTILAHSNPSDTSNRNNLQIKISRDEGRTWTQHIPVDSSEDPADLPWTAYSDMVDLGQGKIGILYERDRYQEIVFKVIRWQD